ncbi:MAG TPA: adenylate/guanylate cyclase domain-containing protein [Anaerolineae bacterium]
MIQINAALPESQRLPVAFGIDTGEVMVGMFGSARKREYTALGHPVNRASHVQQAARAGQILITPETYESVKDRVQVEALTPIQIRSLPELLTLYNVLGLI